MNLKYGTANSPRSTQISFTHVQMTKDLKLSITGQALKCILLYRQIGNMGLELLLYEKWILIPY